MTHPKAKELWTPITPELIDLLVKMRKELGSWREIAAACGSRTRVIRRIYRIERSAVSYELLDRICTTVGMGSVHEFPWFGAEDMIKMGLWDEMMDHQLEDLPEIERLRIKAKRREERRREIKAKRRKAAREAKRLRRQADLD